MRYADLRALGIPIPSDAPRDGYAWGYLQRDCPTFSFRGFEHGPSAVLEGIQLADDRFLLVQSGLIEGLDDVLMGEIVRATRDEKGAYLVTEYVTPKRYAHYETSEVPRDTPLHTLIVSLYGEWESYFNGMFVYVHIPIEQSGVFEASANIEFERIG